VGPRCGLDAVAGREISVPAGKIEQKLSSLWAIAILTAILRLLVGDVTKYNSVRVQEVRLTYDSSRGVPEIRRLSGWSVMDCGFEFWYQRINGC
jgi:hypothetical protein